MQKVDIGPYPLEACIYETLLVLKLKVVKVHWRQNKTQPTGDMRKREKRQKKHPSRNLAREMRVVGLDVFLCPSKR